MDGESMQFVTKEIDMMSRDNETVMQKSSFASSGQITKHFSANDVSQPMTLKGAIEQKKIELNGPQEQSDEYETDSVYESEASQQQQPVQNDVNVEVEDGIDLTDKLLRQRQGADTIKRHGQIGLPIDYSKMG